MKKNKLSLGSLKVESFVTHMNEANANTVKGGTGNTNNCSIFICPVTFGTGGVCDGPAPTRNNASICKCK